MDCSGHGRGQPAQRHDFFLHVAAVDQTTQTQACVGDLGLAQICFAVRVDISTISIAASTNRYVIEVKTSWPSQH